MKYLQNKDATKHSSTVDLKQRSKMANRNGHLSANDKYKMVYKSLKKRPSKCIFGQISRFLMAPLKHFQSVFKHAI